MLIKNNNLSRGPTAIGAIRHDVPGAEVTSRAQDFLDPLLGLRGAAALGVLVVHCLGAGPLNLTTWLKLRSAAPDAPGWLALAVLDTGQNFVLVFFVLSGYLIGKVLALGRYPPDRAGILRFWRSRVLRIIPLLWLTSLVCLAFSPAAQFRPLRILGELLCLSNFTGTTINGVTWSLAYEMQFYALAPFVFMLCREATWSSVARLVGLGLACELFFYLDKGLLETSLRDALPVDFMFFFLIGMAVVPLVQLLPRPETGRGVATAAAIFVAGNVVFYLLGNAGFTFLARPIVGVATAVAIWLVEAQRRPARRPGLALWLNGRAWTWLGILSYGIYLWHYPVLLANLDRLTAAGAALADGLGVADPAHRILVYHAVQIPAVLAISTALSLATFWLVELRFRPGLYAAARNVGTWRRGEPERAAPAGAVGVPFAGR